MQDCAMSYNKRENHKSYYFSNPSRELKYDAFETRRPIWRFLLWPGHMPMIADAHATRGESEWVRRLGETRPETVWNVDLS